jgi:hypothetical protein
MPQLFPVAVYLNNFTGQYKGQGHHKLLRGVRFSVLFLSQAKLLQSAEQGNRKVGRHTHEDAI